MSDNSWDPVLMDCLGCWFSSAWCSLCEKIKCTSKGRYLYQSSLVNVIKYAVVNIKFYGKDGKIFL